jgi:hypothetical protein
MVPFLGHGMVLTLCSVRKNLRNGGMPPPGLPAPLPGHAATQPLPRGHATNGIGGRPLLNLD